MPEYRRWIQSGGTYFFTRVTDHRRPVFADPSARTLLHQSIIQVQRIRPFKLEAVVLLPEHLHTIWTLPENDPNFSLRWRWIKGHFTREYLSAGGMEAVRSKSRTSRKERGLWQRRFWEHLIRDEKEFEALCRYIHYNPVKHDHASCPHRWEFSSFHTFVKQGFYPADWGCVCSTDKSKIDPPNIDSAIVGE
jgi:putative transposase